MFPKRGQNSVKNEWRPKTGFQTIELQNPVLIASEASFFTNLAVTAKKKVSVRPSGVHPSVRPSVRPSELFTVLKQILNCSRMRIGWGLKMRLNACSGVASVSIKSPIPQFFDLFEIWADKNACSRFCGSNLCTFDADCADFPQTSELRLQHAPIELNVSAPRKF